MALSRSQPIGIFDSGVGGLSVLKALRSELPHERFVYVADSGFAPYGERGDAYVLARTRAIIQYLQDHHHTKAMVIACNTATAAAIHSIRAEHPELPLVGVEPALKPAMAVTQTGRVGVIGTRGTLASSKFAALLASVQASVDFVVQPCEGLAHAIERSVDASEGIGPALRPVWEVCSQHLSAMGPFGNQPGQIDTLVLGCTHYIFAESTLRTIVGPEVTFIETGVPVARQTRRLLDKAGLLAERGCNSEQVSCQLETSAQLYTTGPLPSFQAAVQRWLQLPPSTCHSIHIPHTGEHAGSEGVKR